MLEPPAAGTIPENLLNVTIQNADSVIKFIKGITSLSAPLDTDNTDSEGSIGNELKGI